jgi:hypothetical protein
MISEMSRMDKLRKQKVEADNIAKENNDHWYSLSAEYGRVANLDHCVENVLDDIDHHFEKLTRLTGTDIALVILGTALQCIRWYWVTYFPERMDDKDAANQTKGHNNLTSNRKHRFYHPSLEEVKTNPVPFDANIGSDGALKGGGKQGHRAITLGHDPLLGLIFGTANIATSTLTTIHKDENSKLTIFPFKSYHIVTGEIKKRGGKFANQDVFSKTQRNAKIEKILYFSKEKILDQENDGRAIMIESLKQELIHLASDFKSKNSLPLPFISSFNPEATNWLAVHGIDMYNFVKVSEQAGLAIFINWIIVVLHNGVRKLSADIDNNLYQVRTKRILTLSNILSSTTNILYTTATKDISKLDIGGFAVTLATLISDTSFVKKMKIEFIEQNWSEKIIGEEFKFLREET